MASLIDEKDKALANLANYNAVSKLQKAAMAHIADNLINAEDLAVLEKVFHSLDTNNDNRLSKLEIEMALNLSRNPRLGWIGAQIDELFQKLDGNGDGTLDFSEFLVAAADRQTVLDRQHILAVFDEFDKSHTGELTWRDLQKVFREDDRSGQFWKYTVFNVKANMKEADTDHDGTISREEFEAMLADTKNSSRINFAYSKWKEESKKQIK